MNVVKSLILTLIAVVLGAENIIIGYKLFGLSYDRVIEMVIFIALFSSFYKYLKRDKYFKDIILLFLLFLFLKILKNIFLLLNLETVYFIRSIARNVTYIVYFYLAYYLVSVNKKYYIIILLTMLPGFLLAFFQHPLTPFSIEAISIKGELFSVNMTGEILDRFSNVIENGYVMPRVSGPYGFSIILSYILISSAIISTYFYRKTKSLFFVFYLLLITIVSLMTMSRSLLLALLMIYFLLFTELSFKMKILSLIFFGTILGSFTYYMVSILELDTFFFDRLTSIDDKSASGRFPLLVTGFFTVLMNPLGVTEIAYNSMKVDMYNIFLHPEILVQSAHNSFINLGFHYTFFGYILFIYFILYLYMKLIYLDKNDRKFWVYMFFSYFIHSSFHNNGLFIADYTILLVLALYLHEVNQFRIKGAGAANLAT